MNTLFLNEYRCKCGKLLLKGIFFDGTLEIKCKACGSINKMGRVKLENDCSHYLLIINDKGEITNFSNSACCVLGYSAEELIGKHFTVINPTLPKDFGKKTFGSESVLSEDNYLQLDTAHKAKDGKIIPITALLRLYKPNDKSKYVLLSAAVKSCKADTFFLENIDSKFVDKACDFYFEIDKEGVGEYISSSMGKIFGISPEKNIGKKYFDIIPDNQKIDAKKDFEYFSTKGQPYRRTNNDGVCVNGEYVYYDAYFTPNFNNAGKFIGYRVLGWLKKKE